MRSDLKSSCPDKWPPALRRPSMLSLPGSLAESFLSPSSSPRCVTFTCLTPKLWGPYFCLCNLLPDSFASTAHFLCLRGALSTRSLGVCVLTLNSFWDRAQGWRLLNWSPVWLHRSNAWCHVRHRQHAHGVIPLGFPLWLEMELS